MGGSPFHERMNRWTHMTLNVTEPKKAKQQARKPASKKSTKTTSSGNSRKASKPVAKSPKLMSVDDALEGVTLGQISETLSKIDTSTLTVDAVVHIPKAGKFEGQETLKLKVTVGETARYLPEYYALMVANAMKEDAAGFILTLEEYRRGNPHAE